MREHLRDPACQHGHGDTTPYVESEHMEVAQNDPKAMMEPDGLEMLAVVQ